MQQDLEIEPSREVTVQTLDWLAQDALDKKSTLRRFYEKNKNNRTPEQERLDRLMRENEEQKFELERNKAIILAALYQTISKANQYNEIPWLGKNICNRALAMIDLCGNDLKWLDRDYTNVLAEHIHRIIRRYSEIQEKSENNNG